MHCALLACERQLVEFFKIQLSAWGPCFAVPGFAGQEVSISPHPHFQTWAEIHISVDFGGCFGISASHVGGYMQNTRDVWPVAVKATPDKKINYSIKELLLPLLIGSAIGGLFYHFDHVGMAFVVWPISAFLFLCGLLTPRVFQKIEHGLKIFAHWVGLTLTVILLLPFYYLVFVPGRLIQKLAGKDPMTRACPTDLKTYWVTRKPIEDVKAHFERQY